MAPGDFAADLEALLDAAGRIGRSIESVRALDVAALTPSADQIGRADLSDALRLFESRWESGLSALSRDAEEVAGRLTRVVLAYREFDDETTRAFGGLLTELATLPHPVPPGRGLAVEGSP